MIPPGWERVVAYYSMLLFIVLPLALARGGRPEQAAAIILSIGSLSTFAVLRLWPVEHGQTSWPVFAIDATGAVAFVALAIVANRNWTTWLAAVHLLSIMAHLVRWDDPGLLRWVYKLFILAPGWAMLGLILIGIWRHRLRLRRCGVDVSWRSYSSPFAANARRRWPPS